MTSVNTVIGICWLVVMVVWLLSNLGAKKASKQTEQKLITWIRLLMFAVFILFVSVKDLRELNEIQVFSPPYFVQRLGALLCVIGVSFAIWARIHIGKNWAMPMSIHEDTELITKGPFGIVRHPIYSGLCLAMLGSMPSAGLLLFIWYCAWTLYFIYSAIAEEKDMLLQFQKEYPTYQKKTKMFIPFIL